VGCLFVLGGLSSRSNIMVRADHTGPSLSLHCILKSRLDVVEHSFIHSCLASYYLFCDTLPAGGGGLRTRRPLRQALLAISRAALRYLFQWRSTRAVVVALPWMPAPVPHRRHRRQRDQRGQLSNCRSRWCSTSSNSRGVFIVG